MSLISAECFILQWLGHCQGDLIYSPWHFRWHSFHLDVILHDINSDLAARINIAVLFWETSREQTSWTLLHNLHYPAAQRIKRKKMLQFFFQICTDEAATCVWCTVKNVLQFVNWTAIVIRWFGPQFRLSFLAIFSLFQVLLSDCLSVW